MYIIFLILYDFFARNVTFSPSLDTFFVCFAFSQNHRRRIESQNLEAAVLLAVGCMLVPF